MRVTNGVLNLRHWPFAPFDAGWSSPVARQAHNLKAAGSNPAPATKLSPLDQSFGSRLTGFFIDSDSFARPAEESAECSKKWNCLKTSPFIDFIALFLICGD
jgi:hypothetical protein